MSSRPLFHEILSNERGFHLLFCDLIRAEHYSLYENKAFFEDPVFNHFVIDDSLLEANVHLDYEGAKSMIQDMRFTAGGLQMNTSLFLEDFWPRTPMFEKAAIEQGYRITNGMEILTKRVQGVSSKNGETMSKFKIYNTRDVNSWNNVFMSSFSIPPAWKEDLLKRESSLLENKNVDFVISEDSSQNSPVGCLLTFNSPKNCLGIYCVGTIPSMRRRGIGREMLEFSENFGIESGIDLLTLQTLDSDNVSQMYKKMGYKVEFHRDVLWLPAIR